MRAPPTRSVGAPEPVTLTRPPACSYHYHDKVQGVEAAHSFGFQREFPKVLAKGGHITLCTHGFEDPTCNMGIGG